MLVQKLAIFLISAILAWSPFVTNHTSETKQHTKEIQKVIEQRESAVNWKDWKRFERTLISGDPLYHQEQKRWFADAMSYIDPKSYELKIDKIKTKSKNVALVWLKQSFRKAGKLFTISFPLTFRYTADGWRDTDFWFHRLQDEQIRVLYTDPQLEENANIALDIMKRTAYVLKQRFHWKPKYLTLKLYHQPEWFQQSVKLSLPSWAGGWNEAGQSIKLTASMQTVRSFSSGIVHEMTHQLVSDLSHDNAAYWLQEGAAMYYEAHLLPGLHEDVHEQATFRPYTLAQLEKSDLEQLNVSDAQRYYLSCYHFFDFLHEIYGEKKVQQLLTHLRRFPIIDADSSEKIPELNKRTRQALKRTLGKSVSTLDQEWIRYQERQKREKDA